MVRLENLPKIKSSEDINGAALHELLVKSSDKSNTPDIEFLNSLKKDNPELLNIIKPFIVLCKTSETYKIMISSIMMVLKAIDIALDCKNLEE
jgi:hypothetical protein